jgi:hypothetical protein
MVYFVRLAYRGSDSYPLNTLGVSPQLEWWNVGILEKWVLGYCNIG